jgi:hypothetical protein
MLIVLLREFMPYKNLRGKAKWLMSVISAIPETETGLTPFKVSLGKNVSKILSHEQTQCSGTHL